MICQNFINHNVISERTNKKIWWCISLSSQLSELARARCSRKKNILNRKGFRLKIYWIGHSEKDANLIKLKKQEKNHKKNIKRKKNP